MVTTDMATRVLGHIYILSDAGPAKGAGGSGPLSPSSLDCWAWWTIRRSPGHRHRHRLGGRDRACVLPGAVHHLQLQQVRAARRASVTAVVNVVIAMVTRGWQL